MPLCTNWAVRAVSITLLAGCAGNPVRMRAIDLSEHIRAHQVSAYVDQQPSDRTLALLDRLGLATGDHATAVDALAQPIDALVDRHRLLARAELSYSLGDHGNPTQAARRFLDAAFDALAALGCAADEGTAPAVDPLRHRALEAYDYALTRFLANSLADAPDLRATLARLRREFDLEIVWDHGPWQLDDFDRWTCADTLAFRGLRHRYRRPGAGVPLIMERGVARGIPAYLTPEAITRAATAVLETSTSDTARGRLRIIDPRVHREVEVTARTHIPLAADFTAPLGALLAHAKLHEIEDRSFFDSEAAGHEGLFLLEDYDPNRRPIVMVHGLWSSPLTWRDLTNDVFGDETLHRDYQVWHYFYATGVPLLENARQMRAALARARLDLDPELDDFATRELVLVGHSMGGLLSRMMLLSTGDTIWNTLFEGSVDAIDLAPEDLALARELYFWEPLSFVERAIFIAAPHRGSDLSDSFIGRLGSALVTIPSKLLKFVDRVRGHAKVRVEVPTSVDELSGSHPIMRALDTLPIRAGVVYHSIMGDVSRSADPAEWTDSVVRYASSRLDGAASELVISGADHGVHFDPRASAEVRRILRNALREPR